MPLLEPVPLRVSCVTAQVRSCALVATASGTSAAWGICTAGEEGQRVAVVSVQLLTRFTRRRWHDCRAAGRAEVAVVLLDLIAGSRLWLSGDIPVRLGLLLERAEERLREVTGGE